MSIIIIIYLFSSKFTSKYQIIIYANIILNLYVIES